MKKLGAALTTVTLVGIFAIMVVGFVFARSTPKPEPRPAKAEQPERPTAQKIANDLATLQATGEDIAKFLPAIKEATGCEAVVYGGFWSRDSLDDEPTAAKAIIVQLRQKFPDAEIGHAIQPIQAAVETGPKDNPTVASGAIVALVCQEAT